MRQCEGLPDQELVALLQQDELSAFIEIYNRYWSKLFSAAYKRVKNIEACEEIVQDVFADFWGNRNRLTLPVGLAGYLFIAARNRVTDYFRRQNVRDSFMQNSAVADYDNSNEQTVLLRDLERYIDNLIEQLPDKCRSVYRLSRIENRSNKEIASLLNISEKTVEGHLTRALKQLRLGLSDFLTVALIFFLK